VRIRRITRMAVLGLLVGTGLATLPPARLVGAETAVIDDQTLWRAHVVLIPPTDPREATTSPADLPAPNWTKADFDNSGWPRRRGPFFPGKKKDLALICLRTRFGVTAPARPDGGAAGRDAGLSGLVRARLRHRQRPDRGVL
jgi:hypothetical protein